jgi:hypothetical protein
MVTKWMIAAIMTLAPAAVVWACTCNMETATPAVSEAPAECEAPTAIEASAAGEEPTAAQEMPVFGTVDSYEGDAPLDIDRLNVKINDVDTSFGCLLGRETVLVFSYEPCSVNAIDYSKIAGTLRPDISLLEIDVSPVGCDAERTCALARSEGGTAITSLCDISDSVRTVLQVVESQPDVVLLDAQGKVTDSGSMKDFDRLVNEAECNAYTDSLSGE